MVSSKIGIWEGFLSLLNIKPIEDMAKINILKDINKKAEMSYVYVSSETTNRRCWQYRLIVVNSSGNKTTIAEWTLTELPGCSGVCVSHASKVDSRFRGKGIGTLLNTYRQLQAEEMGYAVLLCTYRLDNTGQKKVLDKNGWETILSFTNKKSRNDIGISVKTI